jgi:hypothetical protein
VRTHGTMLRDVECCVRCVVRCMCMVHGNRLSLQGDPEALEIERTRLKLKRFWHSIEV